MLINSKRKSKENLVVYKLKIKKPPPSPRPFGTVDISLYYKIRLLNTIIRRIT